jgi:hypothetical protein
MIIVRGRFASWNDHSLAIFIASVFRDKTKDVVSERINLRERLARHLPKFFFKSLAGFQMNQMHRKWHGRAQGDCRAVCHASKLPIDHGLKSVHGEKPPRRGRGRPRYMRRPRPALKSLPHAASIRPHHWLTGLAAEGVREL